MVYAKMSKRSILDEICGMLETYKGRDKIIRTACYSAKLISGLSSNEAFAKKMAVFSSKMSQTRAVLRLFDDLPMLKYSMEYGLGNEESDQFMASIGVVTNVIDQIYYPIEKIAWLAENNLITANGDKWDTISSIFWVASIYLTLLRSLRYVLVLQKHKSCNSESGDFDKVLKRQKYEFITCLKMSLDLLHAVNTLPKGWLWGTKLKVWHVGLIATTSSFIGIYQVFAKRAL